MPLIINESLNYAHPTIGIKTPKTNTTNITAPDAFLPK